MRSREGLSYGAGVASDSTQWVPSSLQTTPKCPFRVSFAAAATESGAGVIAQVSTSPPLSGRTATPVEVR